MNTQKVNFKEVTSNFNPQRFCEQLSRIVSKNCGYEVTYTMVPKEKKEAGKN